MREGNDHSVTDISVLGSQIICLFWVVPVADPTDNGNVNGSHLLVGIENEKAL